MAGQVQTREREQLLHALCQTVIDATGYLGRVDEDLHDGYQTARDVLSHLVFWHREYIRIIQFLAEGKQPELREGTFAELNAAASCEFESLSMEELAERLLVLEASLENHLRDLPDWRIGFPVKHGSRIKSVAERLPIIDQHIQYHIKRLRRAERLGESWIKAYYLEGE